MLTVELPTITADTVFKCLTRPPTERDVGRNGDQGAASAVGPGRLVRCCLCGLWRRGAPGGRGLDQDQGGVVVEWRAGVA